MRHDDERYRGRFIAAFDEGSKNSLVIADENRDGSLLWAFYPVEKQTRMDKQRAGFLLYREGGQ